MKPQNGDFVRCEDGISLHSKIVDLTYDAEFGGGAGDSKPEKKKEPEAAKGHDDSKKDHKESVTEDGGPKDSKSEPKKKLV